VLSVWWKTSASGRCVILNGSAICTRGDATTPIRVGSKEFSRGGRDVAVLLDLYAGQAREGYVRTGRTIVGKHFRYNLDHLLIRFKRSRIFFETFVARTHLNLNYYMYV